MNTQLKFGLITVIIVGTLAWLGASGINETATYYVTIEELKAMDDAVEKRLRVGGDVQPNSIVRSGEKVNFTIEQEEQEACRWSTSAATRCPTPSATAPKRCVMAAYAPTASSRLRRSKPSARRSTKPIPAKTPSRSTPPNRATKLRYKGGRQARVTPLHA